MATLAEAPGECCIKTVQHSGTPRGTIEKIADVETYITPPSTTALLNQRILLFFADVYGPLYINSKLILDYFASFGKRQSHFSMYQRLIGSHQAISS